MLNGEEKIVNHVFESFKHSAKFRMKKPVEKKRKSMLTRVLDDGTVVTVLPNKVRRATFFDNLAVAKKKNFKADYMKEQRDIGSKSNKNGMSPQTSRGDFMHKSSRDHSSSLSSVQETPKITSQQITSFVNSPSRK